MLYLEKDNGFMSISEEDAAQLKKIPEFYDKSPDVPEELWGTRRRVEIFDEGHPEVQEFLKKQSEYISEAKRKEELRNEAKLAIAKSAGLTEGQIGALFG